MDGNWACRVACRGCGRQAPRSVADAARAAHAAATSGSNGKQGGATTTKERGQPHSQRPAAQPGAAGARSFADVVRSMGLVAGQQQPKHEHPEPTQDMPDETAAQWRYWKERRTAAAKAGDFGKQDVDLCDAKLAELQAVAKASRPWASRVQAATHRHDKARLQKESAQADVEAAKAALAHMEGVLAEAIEEERTAAKELAAVRAEATTQASQPAPKGVEDALAALLRAAARDQVDVAALAARLANGDAAMRTRSPTPLPREARTSPPLPPHSCATAPTIPNAQPDTPARSPARRSRSRKREDDEDGVSEVASETGRQRSGRRR